MRLERWAASIRWFVAMCGAFVLALAAPVARAQSVTSGSIRGVVKDESAAALPGVTVTVSSPALQVAQLTTLTDSEGSFQFRDLPAGVYRVGYELAGFQSVVRDDLRLNVGFAARVDAILKVGLVKETVVVSGQSPVVDVSNTTGSTNFTKETLENIPTTRSMWQVLAMTPGVRMSAHDVGGSKIGEQLDYRNYGTFGQVSPMIEGINTRQDTTRAGFFYDYAALEESQVKTYAADAEVALPGTNWIAVVKSGGNDFHGSLAFAGQWDGLQGDNIDDELRAQGITAGNATKWITDASADLGGRLIRDKLWFYVALRDQRRHSSFLGFVKAPGPDGQYLTGDDEPAEAVGTLSNQTLKLSYQASPRYKLIGFIQRNDKFDNANSADRFHPLESTPTLNFVPYAYKVELQGQPSDTTLFNLVAGRQHYLSAREAKEGVDRPGNPSRFFRDTGLFTGPPEPLQRPRDRWQSTGGLSWFPKASFGGRHSMKLGYTVYLESMGAEYFDKRSGNYRLTYDRFGGVYRPAEIETFNYPLDSVKNRLTEYSAYLKDTWQMSRRLTANLGMRVERYHSFIGDQEKTQGQFGGAGSFDPVDVLTWLSVAPRAGFAFDLKGDGRTLLKASYGWFNHTMGDDYAEPYNRNGLVTTTYRWRDPDGNNDYTPGEVNLSTNGPDFIGIAGSSNTINNPDLEQPVTHEVTVSLERELRPNFGAKALYVYKRQVDLFENVNILRPFSAYNIPITRRDPGADGVLGNADDGGRVTIYDYDPAFRGGRFVGTTRRNAAEADYYHNVELTLNKRSANKWEALGSFGATQNHRQLDLVPESPNDEYNRIDTSWDWQFKLLAAYSLPAGIRAAAFYQHLSGAALQRTYIFRAADPDGGTPLRQLSTVTLRLEPLDGSRRLPQQKLLNVRLSKEFDMGGGRRLTLDADVFNALNSNTALRAVAASGPSFGRIQEIFPPRIARLGARLSF